MIRHARGSPGLFASWGTAHPAREGAATRRAPRTHSFPRGALFGTFVHMAATRATTGLLVRSSRTSAALLALVLGACGGGAAGGSDAAFSVRGTDVVVNSSAAFTRSSDFPARVESTLDAALRYWGGTWSHLEGRTVTFEGERNVRCAGHDGAVGCFDGNIRVTTRDAGFSYSCVEETALVHEVGHAVLGDPDHTDPRWMDFSAVQEDLRGRPGYADGGATACNIYLTVWRSLPAASAAQLAPAGG